MRDPVYCQHHSRKDKVKNELCNVSSFMVIEQYNKSFSDTKTQTSEIIDFAEKHIDIHSCQNTKPSNNYRGNLFETLELL